MSQIASDDLHSEAGDPRLKVWCLGSAQPLGLSQHSDIGYYGGVEKTAVRQLLALFAALAVS